MALKVGELFASFNLDTSGVGSAVKGAEKTLSGMGKSLAIGGAAMSAAITAPLVAAGKDIYKAGSGFDAQMSKVFSIAGDEVTGSVEVMDALRAKALEMGSTTQFTASEAGQAFEYMAMAGWKTESMLAGIEPLMNLAAAAGADLGTTSDIVTDAMTAFGLSATDMVSVVKDGVQQSVPAVEYFADILAATSSNSNTNVTMLGESFKFAAPLAGAFGYTLNDTALALGLMANNGIKSSMAGTSLSRVIQNMVKPTDDTALAMKALGVSLYDADGKTKSLREVMTDFRNAAKKGNVDVSKLTDEVSALDEKFQAGKITESQYEAELEKIGIGAGGFMRQITTIAGARGLPGLLAIMNASEDDFLKLSKSIDNATGSAKKMKEVMLDNVEGDMTIFKSAVEGLEITLWDLVKGPVRGMIQRGTKLADTFRTMDKDTLRGAIRMAGFAAAIGPVMTASGGLLVALPKVTKAIAGLASPAGLVAISLLALGAAAMDAENLMGKNLEKMAVKASKSSQQLQKELFGKDKVLAGRAKAFLNSVQTAITTALPDMMDALSAVLTTALNAITEVLPEAGETATTFVTTLATSLASNMPELVQSLAGTLTALATTVIESAPDMLDAGVTLFTSLIDALGKVNWAEIGTKINGAVKTALAEIRTNFYKLVFGEEPKEGDLGDWGKLGSKLVENIKAGIKAASDNGKNLLGGLMLGADYDPGDSWTDVALKIWQKITGKMGEYLDNAGELVKGLVLGKDYNPHASWADVATKIWETIKAEFAKLAANAKDLVGTIVLGEDYTAHTSWGMIGNAIWNTIKDKLAELGKNAKDLIGTLALGGNYTAHSSWEDIGTAIWAKIKEKLAALGKNAKDLIGELIFGGEYDASDSWEKIGSAIWDKVISGVTNGIDLATKILGKIGSVVIDSKKINPIVQNAGSFVTGLVDKLMAGTVTWTTQISSLAQQIADQLAGFDWATLGTTLGQTAAKLVGSMVDAIPNAVDAAGNLLNIGMKLAGGLLDAIVSGITAIANSGLGNKLADTAVELVKGILGNIGNLGKNADVQNFMTKLGEGMIAAMGMLGDIAGKIVAYVFSPEGLVDIYNAGTGIIEVMLKGMAAGMTGIISFFGNMIDTVLVELGIVDPEAREKARAAGEDLSTYLKAGMEQGLMGGSGGFMQEVMEWSLYKGGGSLQGGQLSNVMLAALNSIVEDAAKKSGDSAAVFKDEFINGWIRSKELDESFWKQLFPELADKGEGAAFFDYVADVFLAGQDDIEAFIKENADLSQYFPDDMNFWTGFLEAVKGGDMTALMTLMSEQAVQMFGEIGKKGAEAAKDGAEEAASEFLANYANTGAKTTEQNAEIVNEMNEAGKAGAKGFATGVTEGATDAEAAALTVSDAAVQQFLLTMSMENGYLIGDNFVLALGSGMTAQSEAVSGIAKSIGGASRGALANAASYSIGERIGANFGQGFVNGIESKIADAAAAAARLGQAGTSGLSTSIQEGSPSKLTATSGVNFDLGFINAILSRADEAADAAGLMGANAARALEYTAHGIGEEAIRQTDYPQKSGYTRSAEAYRSQTRDAGDGDIADRIAEALNGLGLYFDGEAAGHILTRYVSEEIARGAAMRR